FTGTDTQAPPCTQEPPALRDRAKAVEEGESAVRQGRSSQDMTRPICSPSRPWCHQGLTPPIWRGGTRGSRSSTRSPDFSIRRPRFLSPPVVGHQRQPMRFPIPTRQSLLRDTRLPRELPGADRILPGHALEHLLLVGD